VANSLDLTVSKLDPATGTVTATIGVGDGPAGIVAAKDGVWVSNEFDATLDRIDLQKTRVARTVRLGSSPRGMVVAGSGVWVAARPFPSASHRGGTLTVADTYLPDPPDPAVGLYYDGTLTAVYDGLTAFRRSGGAAGLTLVPDLAKTLPRPTAGGTTYTFTLRRGIRYSNGALVRASDFRRGLQRQLSFGLGAAITKASSGDPRASSIRNGAICPPGSSPMTPRAGSPSAWSRRIPISSTSSGCRSPCPHHPARPATSSTGRRSCPAPGRT
jgi:YVTN family beta-propeller protein